MRRVFFLLTFVVAACAGFSDIARSDEARLEKIVVLSRHGVRSPTQSEKVLGMWSQKAWPVWPVGRGELTPRGARLVTAMWEDLSGRLKKNGLLPEGVCPSQKDIFVRADVDERTRATAAAMLEGLAPGCALGYAVEDARIDALFHPVKAGLYKYDAVRVATDILAMTHGGLENLQDEFSGVINLLGNITGPPASSMCARFALMPQCQLADLPNAVSISPDGTSVRLVGSLAVASSVAEIFLLEYGQWPDAPAGWGEVDQRVLSQALPVHSKVFDVVNRASIVAWANGASLLNEMTAALFGEHPDPRANEARLVIFVGHDTNIANVGGLLEFGWQASGYPPNGIPPAGALMLELWRIGGEKVLKARFVAQPPAALHSPFRPDMPADAHAPMEAPVYSRSFGQVAAMPVEVFKKLVRARTADAPLASAARPKLFYGAPVPQLENSRTQPAQH